MSDKPPLPSPPDDLPKRGDAFKHWKHGTVYVVTGRSRSEHDPREFNVHYLPEGVSDEDEIPWRRTYDDFMGYTIPEPQKDWLHPVPVRRFEPIGRRDIRSFLRPEVAAFAQAMEATLRRNDHKGGWKEEDPTWLAERATEELKELDLALQCYRSQPCSHHDSEESARRSVLHEATDVANFCLMVADNCGALGEREP